MPTPEQSIWDASYERRENFLFSPDGDLVRAVSRFVLKRIGLDTFQEQLPGSRGSCGLDLGCGIGRHVKFLHELGCEAYGIDLSATAIRTALEWAKAWNCPDAARRLINGSAEKLPWADGFFRFAISTGVLDSMPFAVAKNAVRELERVLEPRGVLVTDMISGDDTEHAREFRDEVIVRSVHERDTVQSYFNFAKIRELFPAASWHLLDCRLVQRHDLCKGGYFSRYHLVLRREPEPALSEAP